MESNNIKNKVVDWNLRFPLDRWWRQKHKVAYGSTAHREISFFDQLFEWEEDCLFKDINNQDNYVPNIGEWLKEEIIEAKTEQQLIEEAQKEMEFVSEDLEKMLNGGSR